MRNDLFANDIVEAQIILNERIYKAASEAIAEFEEKTGLTPRNIDITMIDHTIIGEHTRYVLTTVTSNVWPETNV